MTKLLAGLAVLAFALALVATATPTAPPAQATANEQRRTVDLAPIFITYLSSCLFARWFTSWRADEGPNHSGQPDTTCLSAAGNCWPEPSSDTLACAPVRFAAALRRREIWSPETAMRITAPVTAG